MIPIVSALIAGLVAKGYTTVDDIFHIDRGYYHMEKDLQCLGANIERITSIKKTKHGTESLLNGVPYVSIDNQQKVKHLQSLTSFETRLFAQGKKVDVRPCL